MEIQHTVTLYISRDVDKGGGREVQPHPLGAIFALEHLKNEAKLGRNEQKWSIPPLRVNVKIRTPLE